MTIEQIKNYKKEELIEASEEINKEDIKQLVEWLSEKDDKLRYPSFLMLQARSKIKNDVYPYWDILINKLESDNSYQRSIGLMLLAENIRWDKENKIIDILDYYLTFCNDEKLITARQCIQSLYQIVEATEYNETVCKKIVTALTSIDISKRPNTNWKVMTTDIVNILMNIEREISFKETIKYLNKVLAENIIDNKLKNEIKELLNIK